MCLEDSYLPMGKTRIPGFLKSGSTVTGGGDYHGFLWKPRLSLSRMHPDGATSCGSSLFSLEKSSDDRILLGGGICKPQES